MKLGKKGQIGIETLFGVLILVIFFFVWIQIWEPISDLLYPELDNLAYGSTILILMQFIPFVIAILIFVFPFLQSRFKSAGQPPNYGY